MNRKHEQGDLIFKLGQLFGPLLRVADRATDFDADEKARIFARFFADAPAFQQAVHAFTQSEPGHDYQSHWYLVHNAVHNVVSVASNNQTEATVFQAVRNGAHTAQQVILSIPIPLDSTIHEARSPFSTYCLVKDLCLTVKDDVVWLDRYFDHTIFHRYFSAVAVPITLLTWPESKCKGKKDEQRYHAFMDASKLFAQERGSRGYCLITNETFHDRWLRCDDKLFTLGGSIKDLGNESTFTISRLDSTPHNLAHFKDAISSGTEVFGPNQTAHP